MLKRAAFILNKNIFKNITSFNITFYQCNVTSMLNKSFFLLLLLFFKNKITDHKLFNVRICYDKRFLF